MLDSLLQTSSGSQTVYRERKLKILLLKVIEIHYTTYPKLIYFIDKESGINRLKVKLFEIGVLLSLLKIYQKIK